MGYTTEFFGEFRLDRPLLSNHANYLVKFSQTRRMKRDSNIVVSLPDPIRDSVELPIGEEGEYYVGLYSGEDEELIATIDHNSPPSTRIMVSMDSN